MHWGCKISSVLVQDFDVWADAALGLSCLSPLLTNSLAGLQQYRKMKDVLRSSCCFFGPNDVIKICNRD